MTEVHTERMVAGGAALGRLPDGRRALVRGALPGETVTVRITREQRGLIHGEVEHVVDAAAERVEPPCPMVAAGCGGCDWQHIDVATQPEYKRDVVVDALARIAKMPDVDVADTVVLKATDYRTTIRGVPAADGVLGLRRTRSHDVVPIEGCLIAHPRLRETIATTTFTSETTIRFLEVDLDVPVAAFFQPHVDAPDTLVGLVQAIVGQPDRLADLYCGVGLFAARVPAGSVVAVERSRVAARAAKKNVRGRVVHAAVEDADIGQVDAVIADPSRTGLGRAGVAAIEATGANTVALVSCDPAAFARDARLLVDEGYELERSVPVDQFGHTSHIEVVSAFRRARR